MKLDFLKAPWSLIVEQRAEMSSPASVRHIGQPLHEVIFVLPLRDDGKIWSGKVTFIASKLIEVEVLHTYEPKGNVDTVYRESYHTVLKEYQKKDYCSHHARAAPLIMRIISDYNNIDKIPDSRLYVNPLSQPFRNDTLE